MKIREAIPSYSGAYGHFLTTQRLPTAYIMEIRREVSHACVKTQTAFLVMMFPWMQETYLSSYFPGDGIDTPAANRAVWEYLARQGHVPDLFLAYQNHDHVLVHTLYKSAVHALYATDTILRDLHPDH